MPENQIAHAARTKKYRERLKREKKCANGCGRPRDLNRVLCVLCGEENKLRTKRHVQDKRQRGECVHCSEKAVTGLGTRRPFCEKHRALHKKAVCKNAREVKETLFGHYGGSVCAWPDCGSTDLDVLSLDHINDNGADERRSLAIVGGGQNFYRWLKKQGYPPGYQVLCMNHQYKKRNMKWRGESLPKEVTNGDRDAYCTGCARGIGEAP